VEEDEAGVIGINIVDTLREEDWCFESLGRAAAMA